MAKGFHAGRGRGHAALVGSKRSRLFSLRLPEAANDWLTRSAIAVVVPPVLAGFALGGLALWWFLFDALPQIIWRWWVGPPWRTPRVVHPFSDKQSAADHAELSKRLSLVETDREARISTYVDRHTGQYWCGDYFEQGFGSGEVLTPTAPPGET